MAQKHRFHHVVRQIKLKSFKFTDIVRTVKSVLLIFHIGTEYEIKEVFVRFKSLLPPGKNYYETSWKTMRVINTMRLNLRWEKISSNLISRKDKKIQTASNWQSNELTVFYKNTWKPFKKQRYFVQQKDSVRVSKWKIVRNFLVLGELKTTSKIPVAKIWFFSLKKKAFSRVYQYK